MVEHQLVEAIDFDQHIQGAVAGTIVNQKH
jgi:hypothetical protein